jgi:hypothetical protein
MAFKYRERSPEAMERRANQSGSDYEGWIRDEYRVYQAVRNENHIRILPQSESATGANESYGMDVWVHFGVGPEKASVICLNKMRAQKCPICEDAARARLANDEDQAREFRATRRVLCFIINRRDESQGVLAYGMPFTLDREINKASRDRSSGEWYFVDSPTNGYDIYFDKTGEMLQTKYGGVQLAKRASAIDPKILDWLEKNPLSEVLRWRTYEEVKRLHEGGARADPAAERPQRELPLEEEKPRRRAQGNGDRPPIEEPPEENDEPEPEPDEEPEPPKMSRPGARAKADPRDAPDPARPPKPSSNGRSRADEIRAKFLGEK